MWEIRNLRICDIEAGVDRRPLRNVAALVESIQAVGLLNPIAVRNHINGRFYLVTGAHRLEACKRLGWQEIPCLMLGDLGGTEVQIIEIDENIVRNELTALERADALRNRKLLYEALNPQARHGGDRRSSGNNFHLIQETEDGAGENTPQTAVSSFADDAAEKTGLSARSIRYDVAISERIQPGVKTKIKGTPIEDSKTELIALSRLTPPQQYAALKAVEEGRADSIKDYADEKAPRPAPAQVTPKISVPRDPLAAARVLAETFSLEEIATLIAALMKAQAPH